MNYLDIKECEGEALEGRSPCFTSVSDGDYVKWFVSIFGCHYVDNDKTKDLEKELGTARNCLTFFHSIEKSDRQVFLDKEGPDMWERKGIVFYRTISRRFLAYDSGSQRVFTRNMCQSECFLAWCEEYFGLHSKEFTGECPFEFLKKDKEIIDPNWMRDKLLASLKH